MSLAIAWDDRRRAATRSEMDRLCREIEHHRRVSIADFDGREGLYAEFDRLKAALARNMGCCILPLLALVLS